MSATLAGELVWTNGEADYRFDVGPVPYDAFLLLRDAFHVPFRVFNGRELSLVPFFEMSEPEFQGVRAPERWTNFTVIKGSVLQTAANGGSLLRLTKGGSVVFVRYLPRRADGSPLTVLAMQDGLHEYTSVSGVVSTVDAFKRKWGHPLVRGVKRQKVSDSNFFVGLFSLRLRSRGLPRTRYFPGLISNHFPSQG